MFHQRLFIACKMLNTKFVWYTYNGPKLAINENSGTKSIVLEQGERVGLFAGQGQSKLVANTNGKSIKFTITQADHDKIASSSVEEKKEISIPKQALNVVEKHIKPFLKTEKLTLGKFIKLDKTESKKYWNGPYTRILNSDQEWIFSAPIKSQKVKYNLLINGYNQEWDLCLETVDHKQATGNVRYSAFSGKDFAAVLQALAPVEE